MIKRRVPGSVLSPAAQAFQKLKSGKPRPNLRKRGKPSNPKSPAGKAQRKVRLKSVNWWKKKAWAVFSKWIRVRDKGVCYTCDRDMSQANPSTYHAGHFLSRRNNATLFDEVNVHGQCLFCNMYDYGATGPYAERLIKDYGLEAFQALLKRSRETKQWTIPELQALIERYKA